MNIKRLLIIAIVVVAVGAGALYFYIQSIMSQVGPSGGTINPQYNYSIAETGVVDYSTDGERSMYVAIFSSTQDIDWLNFTAKQFEQSVPTDIYILDYKCVECTGLGEFKASLEGQLKQYGYLTANATLVPLKINQLERLNKKSIIIVPTGRIPSAFFDRASDANLDALMGMGDVVIYVGNDFSESLNNDGVTEQTDAGAAASFGLAATSIQSGAADEPYHIESGSYKLLGTGGRNATFISGPISALHMQGGGYFIAFPNTIDIGWSRSGPSLAGEDVATVIRSVAWQQPITNGTENLTPASGNRIPSGVYTLFMRPAQSNGGFVRLFVTAVASNGTEYYEFSDANITNQVRGRLENPSTGVNNSVINLAIHFDTNSSDALEFEATLGAFKDLQEVDRQSLGMVRFINISDENRRYTVNLGGGDHILKIQDFNRRTYAQSFLHIPEVTVSSTGADWDGGSFSFVLLQDDQPVPNTPVTISVDELGKADLVTDGAGNIAYRPGSSLGYGDHVFTANATGRTLSVTVTRKKSETFFDKPQNQIIVVGILLVGILAVALQRAEVPIYFLEIPDFPPQQKERIPLPKSTFINLIETLNREYRWKYMPLTTQEIKKGMQKRVSYKGKPILISDYNLEKLLGQLVDSGELARSLGLYGLKGWETLSGKDMRYLAVFRSLRNFFINSAMLFTDVGQRTDCDILVNYRGENLFVHIYDGEDTVRKALANARKGKNFIVFASAEEMREFASRLATSATRPSIALKMEMDNRQITLTQIGALGVLTGKAA